MEPSSADLRYFMEVIREGSMSRAAYKLGLSQPTLSLAIQRIEKALDVPILLRDRSGAKPTKVGEELLKKSHLLQQAWSEIKLVAKSTNDLDGKIVLGCHPEVGIDSLPLFLPTLLEENKNLEVEFIHDLSRNITQKVIEGVIDIGLVVNPRPFPELVMKTLNYDEMGLWINRDNVKNQKNNDILFCQPELVQTQKLLRDSKKKGFEFKRIIHSTDIEVIYSVVGNGCGVGILPSEVAMRNPRYNLTLLHNSPKIRDKIAVIYRQENRTSKKLAVVLRAIIQSHEKKYGKI